MGIIADAESRVATGVISGFVGNPALLLIVILNVSMIVAAGYFLLRQEEIRHIERLELIGIVRSCAIGGLSTDPRFGR